MNNRVLTFIFAALLSVVGAKADGIPSGYFSEVASGEFYLYNVTQQQFLVRLSNNFPGTKFPGLGTKHRDNPLTHFNLKG